MTKTVSGLKYNTLEISNIMPIELADYFTFGVQIM